MMETRNVMVKKGDVAIVTCPSCLKTKKLSVLKYKGNGKRKLKIKCCCAELFDICLECRIYFRKSLKLLGKSVNLSNHHEVQDILIKNISMGGIGFCPFKAHKTRKNDLLLVSFHLNDTNNTQIDTQMTVRSATSDYVGCEFNSAENFKTTLGFYLIS